MIISLGDSISDLINFDIDEARGIKHRRFRAEEHVAENEWVGLPPLVEAFEECIDLLNYLDEALRQGSLREDQHRQMTEHVRDCARHVQFLEVGTPLSPANTKQPPADPAQHPAPMQTSQHRAAKPALISELSLLEDL